MPNPNKSDCAKKPQEKELRLTNYWIGMPYYTTRSGSLLSKPQERVAVEELKEVGWSKKILGKGMN